jgi:hypothetical protein
MVLSLPVQAPIFRAKVHESALTSYLINRLGQGKPEMVEEGEKP